MKKIVLISCVSQKRTHRSKSERPCTSARYSRRTWPMPAVEPECDLHSNRRNMASLIWKTEIDPYNLTLNTMSVGEIRSWADRVLQQLNQIANLQNDHFIFLAGIKYRKYILPHLRSYEVPFEGLPIGKQLQALSR